MKRPTFAGKIARFPFDAMFPAKDGGKQFYFKLSCDPKVTNESAIH